MIDRFEIIKETSQTYIGKVYSEDDKLIWKSESPLTVNELGRYLHEHFKFHQLDINEKFIDANPSMLKSNMVENLALVNKIIAEDSINTKYDKNIVKQLKAWVKKLKQ